MGQATTVVKRSSVLVAAVIAVLMVGAVGVLAGGSTTKCGGVDVTSRGTNDNDTFTGGDGPDVYHGRGGDDTIRGMGAGDILCGGPGDDLIVGGAGDDEVFGGDGADIIDGNEGKDILNGGAGDDVVHAGPDNDTVSGGPGIDELQGGPGSRDVVSYRYDPASVVVRLDREHATKSNLDRDPEVTGFENVIGSTSADHLYGNDRKNKITALEGDDLLVGRERLDVLDGGAGGDRVSYQDAPGGVVVNLGFGRTRRGDLILDRLRSIEIAWGSPKKDRLYGSEVKNILRGLGGNDRLEGREGLDRLFGGLGDDVLIGGGGADILDGGRGTDVCSRQQADTRRNCEPR